MENKDNNQNKRATTGIDADGNMQVRSSGRAPIQRTPARAPGAGGMQKSAKKAPRRAPAVKGRQPQSAQKRDEGVEYSFANSALFNNGAKPRSTDATAVSEARKARTDGTPIQSTDTRVMPAGSPRRPRPTDGTKVMPAVGGRTGERRRPTRPVKGSVAGGAPVSGGTGAEPAQTPASAVNENPSRRPGGAAGGKAEGGKARPDGSATRVTPAVRKKPEKETPMDIAAQGISKVSGAISAMNSVTRALIYIACVMLVSVLLSVIIITNCNDIFAFVKSDEQYTITIESGTDLADLADQLKELGVIEHKNTFKIYIKYRGKESDAYTPGTYTVSPSMSYDQIISAITPKKERVSVSITVPEGYMTDQIIELFVSKGIGTREGFEDVIANADLSEYWFVNELPANADRYYRLEGYLFPDTYYFYTDMSELTIIKKFLDNFEKKFEEEYKQAAEGKGFTVDEIITLASIIQAEGKERIVSVPDEDGKSSSSYLDYELISSVFKNRLALRNPMKLQSDATTLFAFKMDKTGDEKVTGSNKYYENPYNTYNIDGLPPGAICNPGLNAISFALWSQSSEFYYFVSDEKGNTYFAEDLSQHEANVAMVGEE